MQRVLAGPKAFPRQRPVGPARPPACTWDGGGEKGNEVSTVEGLDAIVRKWFEAAEAHMISEFHVDPAEAKHFVGRGGRAQFNMSRPAVKGMKGGEPGLRRLLVHGFGSLTGWGS